MHDEGCICNAVPRPPCSWCENGGNSCKTCWGAGKTPHKDAIAHDVHKVRCKDCGGTGVDPKYHEAGCECTACDPDFREVDPEPEPLRSMDPDGENLKALNPPAIIGMDFGKEPGAVVFSTPTVFPSWVKEAYLKSERDRDYRTWRDYYLADWTPEARPIVVVGTRRQADHVQCVNRPRPVLWAPDHWRVMGMSDFDYVEYPELPGATGIDLHMRAKTLDVIRSRRGARQISVEEAEGRPQRVADLPNHAADALAYMVRANEAIRSTTGLDFGRKPAFADLSENAQFAVNEARQRLLAARRELGRRECEQEERDAHLIDTYGPKTAVPRICGWKREDRQEPATVHQLSDDIGQLPVALPDHRMGWKP